MLLSVFLKQWYNLKDKGKFWALEKSLKDFIIFKKITSENINIFIIFDKFLSEGKSSWKILLEQYQSGQVPILSIPYQAHNKYQ